MYLVPGPHGGATSHTWWLKKVKTKRCLRWCLLQQALLLQKYRINICHGEIITADSCCVGPVER